MKLVVAELAWEDYLFWQQLDQKIVKRIHELVRETARDPFGGIGKPEPLKPAFAGFWSRRITGEHRFVYRAGRDALLIAQLRYHY